MEPVRIPITDVIDPHTFHPRELTSLIGDYIEECARLGFRSVRIVHGKGTGVLKRRVQAALRDNPHASAFADAPAEAGGWGATSRGVEGAMMRRTFP